ncbi:hypothetical protein BH09MYX1_BH09MYX1_10250 [soil metagenome]
MDAPDQLLRRDSGGCGPALCTSGKGTTRDGTTMRPGEACISCHSTRFSAPTFWISGTIYPTGREQNDCKGVAAGATVKITDANNVVYNVPVNSAGNFMLEDNQAPKFAAPYNAEVIVSGKSRPMGDRTRFLSPWASDG